WPTSSAAYTPLRFPGQYFDPETRLHYNLHRHYDPETARYTSPDPLGLTPAPNPDAYVDNPHTWSDPLGLSPHPADGQAKRSRAQDLQPDENAQGSHTVFEHDENGRVTRYQTWIHEPRSPNGWIKGPRFRGTGKAHSGIEPPLYYPKGGGLGISATGENLPRGY
ncbi:type IV secretion protein Rhs, partial [Streptacidiphilus pinicola]